MIVGAQISNGAANTPIEAVRTVEMRVALENIFIAEVRKLQIINSGLKQ